MTCVTQTLRVLDVEGPARWRWLLTTESGQAMADRQVALDSDTVE
jgi:hypothetical protein